VQEISLKKRTDEIHLHIAANRFLHAMVRIIMAKLVEVGRGRLSVEAFSKSLNSREVEQPILVAPPQGLCLLEVIYPKATKSGKGDTR
jgi:tRNA pseudouridine38-40 synthase